MSYPVTRHDPRMPPSRHWCSKCISTPSPHTRQGPSPEWSRSHSCRQPPGGRSGHAPRQPFFVAQVCPRWNLAHGFSHTRQSPSSWCLRVQALLHGYTGRVEAGVGPEVEVAGAGTGGGCRLRGVAGDGVGRAGGATTRGDGELQSEHLNCLAGLRRVQEGQFHSLSVTLACAAAGLLGSATA